MHSMLEDTHLLELHKHIVTRDIDANEATYVAG